MVCIYPLGFVSLVPRPLGRRRRPLAVADLERGVQPLARPGLPRPLLARKRILAHVIIVVAS